MSHQFEVTSYHTVGPDLEMQHLLSGVIFFLWVWV